MHVNIPPQAPCPQSPVQIQENRPTGQPAAGFTLVEMIVVIVILGILGAMGADFIRQGFDGFRTADSRMEIYEEGKIALVRMERELRNAIPKAFYQTPPLKTDIMAGIIDEVAMRDGDGTNSVFGQFTELDPRGDNTITDRTAALETGNLVSLNNQKWNDLKNGTRVYLVTAVNDSSHRMTLDGNINSFSVTRRFYAVKSRAIRFFLDSDGTLKRSTTAVDSSGLTVANFGGPQPLAKNVIQTVEGATTLPLFEYSPASLNRNALVSINFTILKNNDSVRFHKEIQIRNVP